MPFRAGRTKTGGRKKGVIPANRTVTERLLSWGYDPFETLKLVGSGDLQCGVCRGKGTTKYQPAKGEGKTFDRTCESCYGSGKERISPAERSRAAAELAKYCEPQLKAIEHKGSGGGPILTEVRVRFVESDDGRRKDS